MQLCLNERRELFNRFFVSVAPRQQESRRSFGEVVVILFFSPGEPFWRRTLSLVLDFAETTEIGIVETAWQFSRSIPALTIEDG